MSAYIYLLMYFIDILWLLTNTMILDLIEDPKRECSEEISSHHLFPSADFSRHCAFEPKHLSGCVKERCRGKSGLKNTSRRALSCIHGFARAAYWY
jgi:hypothetical protein